MSLREKESKKELERDLDVGENRIREGACMVNMKRL